MAEFTEVWKQWMRMCRAHENCTDCRLRSLGCNLEFPCNQTKYAPDLIERIVMEWAKVHPEKVYPTWGEWLISVGAARNIPTDIPFELANGEIVDPPWETVVAIDDHIPADIAEKLGLEPKEG